MEKEKIPAVLELRLSGYPDENALRCIFNTENQLSELEKMKCCDAVDYILDNYENKNKENKEFEKDIRNYLDSRIAMYAGTMRYKICGRGPNDIQISPSDMEHTNIVKFLKEVKDSQGNTTRYGRLAVDRVNIL